MEIEELANIDITDEDILWVEKMMCGKVHFDSARVNVLKNMDSVDIQAFPGSGKTTILVSCFKKVEAEIRCIKSGDTSPLLRKNWMSEELMNTTDVVVLCLLIYIIFDIRHKVNGYSELRAERFKELVQMEER